jgi:hypothetical protein
MPWHDRAIESAAPGCYYERQGSVRDRGKQAMVPQVATHPGRNSRRNRWECRRSLAVAVQTMSYAYEQFGSAGNSPGTTFCYTSHLVDNRTSCSLQPELPSQSLRVAREIHVAAHELLSSLAH